MTGLIGFVCAGRRAPQAPAALRAMLALTHQRATADDEPFCDGVVCAARSYPVASPGGEAQSASAGDVHVWLDGELFAAPVRGGAGEPPRPVDPAASAQVLLDLYLSHRGRPGGSRGPDWRFLRAIDGVYAAAIYDAEARVVHLIEDRFGLANLFWTVVESGLAWTSTLGAFVELPGFAPVVDRLAVDQFIGAGHPLGDRSLFEGVELVPVGSVVSFDLETTSSITTRYWWWDDLPRPSARVDPREAADELGRVLRRAIEARARPGERVGVSLSGGLDSRALLAALPDRGAPIGTVTFGQPGCLDIAIARRTARLKGAGHVDVAITADNWLDGRPEAVWWTDGHYNLTNLHGVESRDAFLAAMDVVLDGYAGDFVLGGMYLNGVADPARFERAAAARWMRCDEALLGDTTAFEELGRNDFYYLENRARRLNNPGTRFQQTYMTVRRPFVANEVVEFVYSLPDELRRRGSLYHRMLRRTFPDYYRTIPWQTTGIPIGWPRGSGRVARHARAAMLRLTGGALVLG
ncbi:MAG TPA: asparagine synthase-related protein, partial [Thermoleophilia bacterium]|nr:asparagine synthase-related protein [Thermoleophilia bacterium]